MKPIATIVLILGLCLPQTLIAGVILQAGEIDSSRVKVGVYAEVIYGMDERDQVSGKWEKLDTVKGYIKAVDAESLTIGRGFWKEQIAFEHIQKLIMAESNREMDRLKETTDTLSVKKENGNLRMIKKLGCSALTGFLSGIVFSKTARGSPCFHRSVPRSQRQSLRCCHTAILRRRFFKMRVRPRVQVSAIGNGPGRWLCLQQACDLWRVEQSLKDELAEISPVNLTHSQG